jgi:uncharacterized membrane protein YtjA (UPF0391 family)
MFWLLFTIAIIFMVLSIVAGIFGFRGVARAGCLVSRIIFFILVAGFVVTVLLMLFRFIF